MSFCTLILYTALKIYQIALLSAVFRMQSYCLGVLIDSHDGRWLYFIILYWQLISCEVLLRDPVSPGVGCVSQSGSYLFLTVFLGSTTVMSFSESLHSCLFCYGRLTVFHERRKFFFFFFFLSASRAKQTNILDLLRFVT